MSTSNVIFQNLLDIKKPGNWQGLSNFSTWTFFLERSWVTSQSFWSVISAQLNNQTIKTQNNNQHNHNENIHSSQENTTLYNTTPCLHCPILWAHQPKYLEKCMLQNRNERIIYRNLSINIVFLMDMHVTFPMEHGSLCLQQQLTVQCHSCIVSVYSEYKRHSFS